jgi:hypothetical protein
MSCIDTMKPLLIDETEELERVQGLKQRENLLKGMGINEFIHRILFGTPGNLFSLNFYRPDKKKNGYVLVVNVISFRYALSQ